MLLCVTAAGQIRNLNIYWSTTRFREISSALIIRSTDTKSLESADVPAPLVAKSFAVYYKCDKVHVAYMNGTDTWSVHYFSKNSARLFSYIIENKTSSIW